MKKQTYQKPAMRVVKIQQAQMLCTSGGSGEPSMSNSITDYLAQLPTLQDMIHQFLKN